MTPGQYFAVLTEHTDSDLVALQWREQGFELRDCLLVFRPSQTVGFVLLFRKPLQEPSTPEQVAATGTGGLDISGSRIPYISEEDFAQTRVRFKETHRVGGWTSASKGGQRGHNIEGRWPPNALLIHEPGCRRRGAWECLPSCQAVRLERESPGVTRLYPQFTQEANMIAWVRRLMTPAA